MARVFGEALVFADTGLHGLAEGGNWQFATGGYLNNVVYPAYSQKSSWQACRRQATPNTPQHNELLRSI